VKNDDFEQLDLKPIKPSKGFREFLKIVEADRQKIILAGYCPEIVVTGNKTYADSVREKLELYPPRILKKKE